jgi:NAD-dependent DNA ligase
MPPKKAAAPAKPVPNVNPSALAGKTMIITGDVVGYDRTIAQQILTNAGATIAKSLNKSVNLVALGEKAGPKKIEKIEEMGIETRAWNDLLEEISASGATPADNGAIRDDWVEVEAEDDEDEDMEVEEEKPKPKTKRSAPKAKANTKAKTEPATKAKGGAKASTKASVGSSKAAAETSVDLTPDFSIEGKEVLVTGTIAGHTRKTVTALLENKGATVGKTLNADLDLVILGAKPGPDKMAKIADWGLPTVSWNALASHLGLDYGDDEEDDMPEPQTLSGAPSSIEGTLVLITGTVDGYTRTTAAKALESCGAKTSKGLTKDVELVVLGVNPGPDKVRKINDMGIPTCDWEDLARQLDLPEPSAPPKKKARKA